MVLARNGPSLTQTPIEALSSVQMFAMIVAGALALSMPMVLMSMGHVALTQVVTEISGETSKAQIGTAA